MLAGHVSSVADRHRVTNFPWKRCPVKTEFERDLISEDRHVRHEKNWIEYLCRQLHFANEKKYVYFRPEHLWDWTEVYTIWWILISSPIYTAEDKSNVFYED